MPSFHLPHFNDIAILRSIEPSRFRIFLMRFDTYLRNQGFTIPESAVFTDADLQCLIGIFNAHDGSTPADMIEALFHVSEVANDQGMEALLLVVSKSGIELPEGDLTPADLALLIWLNDPDLLRRANCERIVLRFQPLVRRLVGSAVAASMLGVVLFGTDRDVPEMRNRLSFREMQWRR